MVLPLKMRSGSMAEPSAQAPWMTVIHLVPEGLTCFGLPVLSDDVTTLEVEIWPN